MGITHSTVSPHRSVDATGRALPMTVEEIHAQADFPTPDFPTDTGFPGTGFPDTGFP